MKTLLSPIVLFFFILFISCKPDPIDILDRSYYKCQSVEKGYYEMTKSMKYMSGKDTTSSDFLCHFKKLDEDSLYSSAFHYKVVYEEGNRDVMYTGEEFVTYSESDSSGRIMSVERWAKDIDSYSHNYTFYLPLFTNSSFPIPKAEELQNDSVSITLIGEEKIGEYDCYIININEIPENDPEDMIQTNAYKTLLWINKEDYIPVQYSIAVDIVMNNDTMYQYERNTLKKYAINNSFDEKKISLKTIPAYIKLEDYVPYKSPELLTIGTEAPEWKAPDLKGDSISLSDFRGELVLLDFFYKSCYPCMLALPGLQKIHEKFDDQGLKVIGFDPYDTEEDEMPEFLKKRNVSYTVVLGDNEVSKEYHVSGYPTFYLIDRDGRILHAQSGYGEGVDEKLEKLIEENL